MRTLPLFLTSVSFFSIAVGKTLYFPHYGDGGGLSTIISVCNDSDYQARGYLRFYKPSGGSQSLPFSNGSFSSISLSLSPKSTRVFETTGNSNPMKSGYIVLELDQEQVGGVAIFKFASGMEASVLPQAPKRRYSLFVERSSSLDTGVAILREGRSDPVRLRLFNSSGSEIRDIDYDFSGDQQARFVGEIFSGLPTNFTGHLIAEASDAISMTGLRYGKGVLSTVPVEEYRPYALGELYRLWEPSGLWIFGYTIISTFTDMYTIFQVVDLTPPQGAEDFWGLGFNEYGDVVVASYDNDLGLALLDQGIIIHQLFVFEFVGRDEIEGCYYQIDAEDGSFSKCYDLQGLRFDGTQYLDATSSSVAFHSMSRLEIEDFERAEVERSGGFSRPGPRLLKLLERMKAYVARLD